MKNVLLLVFIACLSSHVHSQESKVTLDQATATWINSEYVKDKYLVKCYIPVDAKKPADSLPVIFVLDADISFGLMYDVVRWLRLTNEIPEVAIVGIAYGDSLPGWWQKRSRDFTSSQDRDELWGKWPTAGGAENFIQFISKELLPYLETKFNLKSNKGYLAGLSFGGLFAMDMLFTKPGIFRGYIIASPALLWNQREIFKKEASFSANNNQLDAIVFTAAGSLDDSIKITGPWKEFNQQVTGRKYKNLVYKAVLLENETHISIWPAAISQGLRFVLNK